MRSVPAAAKASLAAALLALPQGSELVPHPAPASDGYGNAVAVGRHAVFVGAWRGRARAGRSGIVHVFEHGHGGWSETSVLAPRSPAPDQHFGASLAVHADTLLVGAPGDREAGRNAGAVFVFERTDGGWRQSAKLLAVPGRRGQQLGYSVAIDGDRALLGAIGYDVVARGAGAAYVFERSGTGWSQVARLAAGDAGRGALFGHAVALEGDVALVGANRDGKAANRARGAAYVFELRTGSSDWRQVAKLVPPVASRRSRFGHALDLGGGIAAIGDRFGVPGGAVHIYVRENGAWAHEAILRSPSAHASEFGWAVDVDGDSILVGDRSDAREGAVACFLRDAGSGWTARALFRAPEGAEERGFGFAVGQGASRAFVGAAMQAGDEPGAAFTLPLPRQSELRPLAWGDPLATGTNARGWDGVWISGRPTAGIGFFALRSVAPHTPFDPLRSIANARTRLRRSPVSPAGASAWIHSISVQSLDGSHGPPAVGASLLVESWCRPATAGRRTPRATVVMTTLEVPRR